MANASNTKPQSIELNAFRISKLTATHISYRFTAVSAVSLRRITASDVDYPLLNPYWRSKRPPFIWM